MGVFAEASETASPADSEEDEASEVIPSADSEEASSEAATGASALAEILDDPTSVGGAVV